MSRARQRRSTTPLTFDELESRALPSTFLVVNSADNMLPGSLRYALNQANQDPGSTVVLAPTVTSPINLVQGELPILANLTIQNQAGAPVTILQARPGDRVFHASGSASSVSINGGGPTAPIIVSGGSVVGADGGGILVDTAGSQLTLAFVQIIGNSAVPTGTPGAPTGGLGGGIYAMGSVALQASSVIANRGDSGGGGIGVNQGSVTLTGSTVRGNQSRLGTGAGIAVASGSVSLAARSHVDRNTAADVGGIMVGAVPAKGDTAVSVTGNSTVDHNVSTAGAVQNQHNLGGGGIAVISDGNIYINHSQVSNNRTVGMYSGGIVVGVGNVTVTNRSRIVGNSNNGPGGGIAANFGGKVTINAGSEVSRNRGSALGGGIVNFSGLKGHIALSGHSRVSHNTLTNGETIGRAIATFLAVVYQKSNFATFAGASGGAGGAAMTRSLEQLDVAVHRASALLREVQKLLPNPGFLVAGGGIAALLTPVAITGDSEVSGNLSGKNVNGSKHLVGLAGGVFQVFGPVIMNQGHVDGNRAPFGDGGGIWLGRGRLDIHKGSTIDGNTTTGRGGGLFNGPGASATIRNTSIRGNRADLGGGIVNRGRLLIASSTLAGNHASLQGGGIFNAGSMTLVDVAFAANTPNNVA